MTELPIYTPPPGLRTAIDDFKDFVNESCDLHLTSYEELHNFSITRLNDFWLLLWRFLDVKSLDTPQKINENASIDEFPLFFQDVRLNFAENLLRGDDEKLAVIDMEEDDLWNPRRYTWKELRSIVGRYANSLRASGISKGEIVVVIGRNSIQSLALLLATASVGGIFSSFATDMGEKALSDRLDQLEPHFLFAESAYTYNGKRINILPKISRCFRNVSGLKRTKVVIIGDSTSEFTNLETFLTGASSSTLTYEQVPFNTPLVIMFSSGTTGTPKGIVHSHGGLLLNGLKEHRLHNNFGTDDVHFHYSNIGWTLWNISIGALLSGTTMILYDGSPFYPNPDEFLKALFANGVTGFGAGPRYYAELQKRNVKPRQYANRLHTVFSTGAVLTPSLARWIAKAFGPVCQISFSGGTELCGSFVHGSRSLPNYPGEIAVNALGMDVVAFSPDGKIVPDGVRGELVCRKPFPNMPVMFWKDPGRKRYFDAYFKVFPHVWTHGDFIKINPETKGIYILGRSDGTLNPSGIRFGSSEIYNVLSGPEFQSSIIDAVVVGQQRTTPPYSDMTERVLLFIKCHKNASSKGTLPTKQLDSQIRARISNDLSRRHVPAHIFEVNEIPYNANGKKMEIQVKAVVNQGYEAVKKQRLIEQELANLALFAPFYHLEIALSDLKGGRSKL